jgi:hypothetical protein
MNKKELKGAAAITHRLKEYGYGQSMEAGLQRLELEGEKKGFQLGINYALHSLSLKERIMGRRQKK